LTFQAWDQSALTGANYTPGTLHDIDPSGTNGSGTGNTVAQSYSAQVDTVSLTIEAPPVVTTSGGATFIEPNNVPGNGASAAQAAAVAIDAGVSVANIDFGEVGATLNGATVTISGHYVAGEDVLSFTNNAATMGNIAVATNAGGVLTLTSAGNTATLAQWQAALQAVKYYDTSDTPDTTARTITFAVTDATGVLHTASATDTLHVSSTDDSPVLDNTVLLVGPEAKADVLTPPSGAVGILVSSLVGPQNESDADGPAVGLVVVAADTAHGSWYYSTDNGAHWLLLANASHPVSDADGLHLLANSTDRLFFLPNSSGWSGTVTDALTFRAWDQASNGATTVNGGVANIGDGGFGTGIGTLGSAYSSAEVSIDVVIKPPTPPAVLPPTPPTPPSPPEAPTAPKPTDPLYTAPGTDPTNPAAPKTDTPATEKSAVEVAMDAFADRPETPDLMLVGSVGNRFVIPEQAATIAVPPNVFRHTNGNENLTYEARRPDGSPLPQWLAFDARNLTFHGKAPNTARGAVDIVIVAKDTKGNSAEAQFKILVGQDVGNGTPAQDKQPVKAGLTPPAHKAGPAGKKAGPAERHGDAGHGAHFASLSDWGAPPPAGRAGFSAQLHQAGRSGLLADAKALAEALFLTPGA
jgi:hypothetical protein